MAISREDVEHLAELSRINLTPGELEKYQEELSLILDYVGQLKEVDDQSADFLTTAKELKNNWREDEIKDWSRIEVAAALEQGEIEAGQVKVKRVL